MIQDLDKQLEEEKISRIALMHPIRRCPSDVLKYLFEWAVEIDEDVWLLCANRYSSVCRWWREVALQTPGLWSAIHVSSASKSEDVQAFWSRTINRVRSVPMDVTITIDGTTDAHAKTLQQCRLDLIPCIEDLEFRLRATEAGTFLASGSLHLPKCPIAHLELKGNPNQAMDIAKIACRFPTA
jgi:hypothetical protein